MLRAYLVSLWAWIRRLSRDLLALPFFLAAIVSAAATIQIIRLDILPDFVVASIVAPLFIGLLSLVPRIGGALSLGGSIGAGIGLVALIV